MLALMFLVASAPDELRSLLSRIDELPTQEELATVVTDPEIALGEIAMDAREHAYVRERAIAALGMLRTQNASKPLVALCTDKASTIRKTAAYTLGRRFGATMPEEVYRALTPLLADKDPAVRRQVIRALGQVPKHEVIAALTARLPHEKDAAIREQLFYRAVQLEAAFKQQTASVR